MRPLVIGTPPPNQPHPRDPLASNFGDPFNGGGVSAEGVNDAPTA
jgi:hypothetical protein